MRESIGRSAAAAAGVADRAVKSPMSGRPVCPATLELERSFLEHNAVAEMDVRCSRVDAELHPQRTAAASSCSSRRPSGSASSVPEGRLEEQLQAGMPLRVKLGIDPTAPDIHLGQLRCAREAQPSSSAPGIHRADHRRLRDPDGDPSGHSADSRSSPFQDPMPTPSNSRNRRSRSTTRTRRKCTLQQRVGSGCRWRTSSLCWVA